MLSSEEDSLYLLYHNSGSSMKCQKQPTSNSLSKHFTATVTLV